MKSAVDSDGLGGPPDTRWRNRTDDTWYQLVSSLRKPCAVCLRRHGRVAPQPGPIPFHPHCECEQLEIPAGAQAPIEFRSAGGLAATMPVGGHDPSGARLVGPLNRHHKRRKEEGGRMSEFRSDSSFIPQPSSFHEWDDLFDGNGDPRNFDQVVKRKRLTVDQLVAAGIAEGVARRAVGLGPLGRPPT